MECRVKDASLGGVGKKKIEWAETHMPVLGTIRERFLKEKPLEGVRIAMALHVEPKTCVLAKTLRDGGAKVAITGCNPLTTQDDAAAALAEEKDIDVFCWRGETDAEYYENLNLVLDIRPHITIDDGCDLIKLVHTTRKDLLETIIGGCEETTTGIKRLIAMEKEGVLNYPVMNVNDSQTKYLFDNRYGTGQSTLDGLFSATNLLLAGKVFVVAGYGWCGRGIAMRAKGMGSSVVVTEIDPTKAVEAIMDGFRVMPMRDAAKIGDIFVTATGNCDVITKSHIKSMKDGAMLANSGHFDNEIDKKFLEENKYCDIRPNVREYTLEGGRKVCLLADGRLVNLVAGQGHPAEVMDLSFANQALGAEYLVKNKDKLDAKVYEIPLGLDNGIAKLKLKTLGVDIDKLSKEQISYLSSWKEGT